MTAFGPETQTPSSDQSSFTSADQALIEESFVPVATLASAMGSEAAVVPATVAKPSFFAFTVRTIGELRFVKFALMSFVINNLRRRYQRSVLGFAWSLLNPLLMMIVLTAVFSLLFHRDPRTYTIYVFTGMLPWTFMFDSVNAGCMAITNAENFMKKVYIPKIFFPLVVVCTEVINFVLSLISMMFLALFVGLKLHLSLLLLPVVITLTFFFTFGIVLSLAVATVYFRDLTHLVRVILTSFFYLIPIIYPANAVPEKFAVYFRLNPFTHIINLYRQIIYYGQFPSRQEWLIPLCLTAVTLTVGFYILMKKEKDIIFRL